MLRLTDKEIAEFRALWEKPEDQRTEADDSRRVVLQHKAVLVLTCCKDIQRLPIIRGNAENGKWRWVACADTFATSNLFSRSRRDQNIPTPTVCPFCAKKLPNMVKVDIDAPVCVDLNDDGYYCDTCKERLMACRCLPMEACWQPV